MGNSATSKMMPGKELTLTNVLYVPEINKNLVSGSLLNSYRFQMVFKSDKFGLSKSGMYVGKGYTSDGMWQLNVMTIINVMTVINKEMNKAKFLLIFLSLLIYGMVD